MSAKILIADKDMASAKRVSGLLQREGYAVETVTRGQELVLRLTQESADLIILERELNDGDGLVLCRQLRQMPTAAKLPIVILSRLNRSEEIVAGMQAGADDYLIKRPGVDAEIVAKVKALLARSAAAMPSPSSAPARGRLISFFSPKGGVGTTTMCVNAAFVLAKDNSQKQTLVVDMVLPLGTVGQFVNFHSDKTLAQLTRDAQNGVDPELIRQYVGERNQYNFRVLLDANDFHEARTLEVNQIRPVFREMVKQFDYVLVDVGRSLSAITIPLLQMSDLIVMILNSDVNTVKLGKQSLLYLREVGVEDARLFVINNRSAPRVWISKEEMEATLGVPVQTLIPYDGEQIPLAVNQGTPYMARFGSGVAGLQFQEMTRQLVRRLKVLDPLVEQIEKPG